MTTLAERWARFFAFEKIEESGRPPVGWCPECDAHPGEAHSAECLANTSGSKRVRA